MTVVADVAVVLHNRARIDNRVSADGGVYLDAGARADQAARAGSCAPMNPCGRMADRQPAPRSSDRDYPFAHSVGPYGDMGNAVLSGCGNRRIDGYTEKHFALNGGIIIENAIDVHARSQCGGRGYLAVPTRTDQPKRLISHRRMTRLNR